MFNYRRYSNSSEGHKSAPSTSPSSSSDDHGDIDDTCCCSLLGVFRCAPAIAGASLTADVALVCASGESELTYALIPLLLCSIVALAFLTSGVRKERRLFVRIATFVALIKSILSTILTVAVLAVYLNYDEFYRLTQYTITLRVFIELLVGLSIILILLAIQTYISIRAAEVIAQRDRLYIIPSSGGESALRPSVKRALAQFDLNRHNLGVEVF